MVKFAKRILKFIFFIQLLFTCFYLSKAFVGHKEKYLKRNDSTELWSRSHLKSSVNTDNSLNNQPFVTIVTAFYHFSKSKHSTDEYKTWLPNLFMTVEQPMVIFTDVNLASRLKSFRRTNTATIIVTNYSTPWQIPVIERIKSIFKSQVELDPENSIHSPDLYAIWAAKPWLMNYTAFWNPFRTRYFMWIDAGAFRHSTYRFHQWPYKPHLLQLLTSQDDDLEKLLFGLVNPIPMKLCKHTPNTYNINNGPIVGDIIQGTMFVGCLKTLSWWAQTYFSTLDLFIKNAYFIGKDQSIMNAIAFSQPSKIQVIALFKVNCGNPWFAFGPILANPSDNSTSLHACFPKNLHTILYPLDKACDDITNTVSSASLYGVTQGLICFNQIYKSVILWRLCIITFLHYLQITV